MEIRYTRPGLARAVIAPCLLLGALAGANPAYAWTLRADASLQVPEGENFRKIRGIDFGEIRWLNCEADGEPTSGRTPREKTRYFEVRRNAPKGLHGIKVAWISQMRPAPGVFSLVPVKEKTDVGLRKPFEIGKRTPLAFKFDPALPGDYAATFTVKLLSKSLLDTVMKRKDTSGEGTGPANFRARYGYRKMPDRITADTVSITLRGTASCINVLAEEEVAYSFAGQSRLERYRAGGEAGVERAPARLVVDLNGDDVPDEVRLNEIADHVTVYLGSRDGRLSRSADVPVGLDANAVLAADLNEDGVPDLIVNNKGSADLSVLRGFGDGGFQDEKIYASD